MATNYEYFGDSKIEFEIDGFTINAKAFVGGDNGVKLQYSANLESMTRIINNQNVVTRLKGRGESGMTIEGLDVSAFSDADLTGFSWSLVNGKKIINKDYVNSQFINNYPMPKEAIREWSEINEQMNLFNKMRLYIKTIELPEITYDISFYELIRQGVPFSDVNLGDIITVIDNDMSINVRARVVELNENELKPELSTARLASRRQTVIDYLTEIGKSKDLIDTNTDQLNRRFDTLDQMLQDAIDVINGVDSKVILTETGILVVKTDTLGPNGTITNTTQLLKIANGALGCSLDGGTTYKTAVTPKGVSADMLVGNIIYGRVGDFRNLVVKDGGNNDVVRIGPYRSAIDGQQKYGIQITNGALEIVGKLPKSQIDDTLLNEISDLNISVDNIGKDIEAATQDNLMTGIEAAQLDRDLSSLKNESTNLIAEATSLNISTENISYQTALTDLENYLKTNWIGLPEGTYPKAILSTDRTTMKTKFSAVENNKTALISKIIQARETRANGYADTKFSGVSASVATLKNDIAVTLSDAKVTQLESTQLKRDLESLKSESTGLLNEAVRLNVTTEKNNYSTALTNLETYLNTYVGKPAGSYPISITSTERDALNGKFKLVEDAKTVLVAKITSSIDSTSAKLNTLYNGVMIDATNGVTVTRSDNKARVVMNGTQGIKIQAGTGSGTWYDRLYADTNGDLYLEDIYLKKIRINDGSGNLLLDSNTKTIDFSQFNVILGKDSFLKGIDVKNNSGQTTFKVDQNGNVTINGNITMNGSSYISWGNIQNKPVFDATYVGARPNTWSPSYNDITGAKPPINADSTLGTLGAKRMTYIDQNGIYTGSIDALQITTGTIATKRIYGRDSDNAYLELVGQFGDIKMTYLGKEYLNIRNEIDGITFKALGGNGGGSVFWSNGQTTYAYGTWDFGSATVRGLAGAGSTAKFG